MKKINFLLCMCVLCYIFTGKSYSSSYCSPAMKKVICPQTIPNCEAFNSVCDPNYQKSNIHFIPLTITTDDSFTSIPSPAVSDTSLPSPVEQNTAKNLPTSINHTSQVNNSNNNQVIQNNQSNLDNNPSIIFLQTPTTIHSLNIFSFALSGVITVNNLIKNLTNSALKDAFHAFSH